LDQQPGALAESINAFSASKLEAREGKTKILDFLYTDFFLIPANQSTAYAGSINSSS